MAATGTASRNAAPHQKVSTSAPPITGPAAMPSANIVAQMPIATARRRASRKMLEINDSVEGMSVAPATPSRARATISSSAFGAKAARIETAAKAVVPITSRRLRPIRSPRVPMVSRNPAMKKP